MADIQNLLIDCRVHVTRLGNGTIVGRRVNGQIEGDMPRQDLYGGTSDQVHVALDAIGVPKEDIATVAFPTSIELIE